MQGVFIHARFKVICLVRLISTFQRGCQNQPRRNFKLHGGWFPLTAGGGEGAKHEKNLPYRLQLFVLQNSQLAGENFCGKSSPSCYLSLSLQNAVGAKGTGTDVTGFKPHPFSTLPVLIGCSRNSGRRPVHSPPPKTGFGQLEDLLRAFLENCKEENWHKIKKMYGEHTSVRSKDNWRNVKTMKQECYYFGILMLCLFDQLPRIH